MSEAVGDRSRGDEEGDGSDVGPAATTLPDIQVTIVGDIRQLMI